ncbi:glycosyltransferase involved in cell wall biosynthesis [Marisediminicola sp. UYEF4]|uniref:glycosyltransferase n=1 Tax=Marisediminicola sp. UYEF4 TaxID=1756384 RepID=UPI0033986B7B
MATQTALDAMRDARSILEGIRSADDLTVAASRDGGTRAVRLLAQAANDTSDQLTAIAAVHSLAQVFDESADEVLIGLLSHNEQFLREHAAWAFGARLPRFDAIAGLAAMVIAGGFSGMLAQRTLEQWGSSAPEHVGLSLEGAVLGVDDASARSRLVETIGLIPGRIPERLLRRIAADADEATEVRAVAIAGLGDRDPNDAITRVVTGLVNGTGELADVARLALLDLTAGVNPRAPWSQGLTIAQLFLHADIDRALSQVGAGDNGGIATLLVRLGDALVAGDPTSDVANALDRDEQVSRVLTLSRGSSADALACLSEVGSTLAGHAFASVPFQGEPVQLADAWPRRIAAQRGIRRVLRAAGTVDAIHLRMADIGTLAATTVARELEIPVVFTVAPDPHGVIHSLDASGTLTRANFGTVDEREHFWFRARLVQRLAADAAHTVLFPRADLGRTMRDLVGIDIAAHPERHSVVAEGIDIAVIEAASADARTGAQARDETPALPAFETLDALLSGLPDSRRTLPLAITVGRLHRVKGMATLVETWAADAQLRERCNLLIIGGDLDNPSADEREQLDRITAALPGGDAGASGLILAGHRANDTAARWLAAARFGRPGLAAPHGVYVCASMKEEFGIALLEAMATGLPVVAPAAGGPATYVEQGVTGFLVDTSDRAALAAGISDALDAAVGPFGPENARRASDMVAGTFTIQAMATTLATVYRDVAGANEVIDWALSTS